MDDLISRKEAIDSICRTVCDNPEICESPCDEIKVLEIMPSAQTETHEERTETYACDSISRQAAIDAMKSISDSICEQQAIDALCELPSATPDMSEYSDKLWKAAYERGKAEALDEIVRCEDCKNRGDDDCPMRFIEWVEYDDDGYIEHDDIIHDYTKDDGF